MLIHAVGETSCANVSPFLSLSILYQRLFILKLHNEKTFYHFNTIIFSLFTITQKNKTSFDIRLTGIDAGLEKILKDWKIAGFAVAVVEKNKIVYSKGFGYCDNEKMVNPKQD